MFRNDFVRDFRDKFCQAKGNKANEKVQGNQDTHRFVEPKFLEEAVWPFSDGDVVRNTDDAVDLLWDFKNQIQEMISVGAFANPIPIKIRKNLS